MVLNNRFRLLLPALALLAAASLSGFGSGIQAQVLRGRVVEAEEADAPTRQGEPVPVAGAKVVLLMDGREEGPGTLTDSLGLFSLPVSREGTYGLRVLHPAYRTYESAGIRLGAGESVGVQVRLGKNVIPLEPLVVVARSSAAMAAFHDRRTRSAFATFLTRQDIETRAPGKTTDLLRGLPGVFINFERWGVASTVEMRGSFGNCQPAIWVDGVRIPQVAGSKLDDFLNPDRIEGVEVYSSFSTAPAQYVSGICGVILFWTRRGEGEGGQPWAWKRMLLGFGAVVLLGWWIL